MDNATGAVIERIWARNACGGDFNKLEIDDFLRERISALRVPIIRPLADAKRIVRRAMEVGYYEVLRIKHEQPCPIAEDFDKLEHRAAAARKALDSLFDHLLPTASKASNLALAMLTAQAGFQDGTAAELHEKAEADSFVLWHAREIIQRLEKVALKKSRAVMRGHQNPGLPEHRVFVLILSEAWVYLTGKKPGSTPDHSKNPFLRFATIAWRDAFDPEENSIAPEFIGALRKLPNWSPYHVSKLASDGPEWRCNF